MPDIASLIRGGAEYAWIYLPVALVLGALHALEPGHSKSMMAAFIIAVRGTPWQAACLGLSAAVGHTLVIWVLVLLGLWLGDQLILERAEPWLILAAGLLIVVIAMRIVLRAGLGRSRAGEHHAHDHGHPDHGPGDHQPHPHDHDHAPDDPHAAAHAADLKRQLAGRPVTTTDIVWFGFTAGLIPCPAAFAVLLVCLQLGDVALGVAMVAAFSLGLAATLVAIGVAAAWGAAEIGKRTTGYDRVAVILPYVSAALMLAIGVAMSLQGLMQLRVI